MRSHLHVVRNLLHPPQAGPAMLAAATEHVIGGDLPTHEPRLVPRDEAAFLLNAAAEIEHALMVQYLFAAYSVRTVPGDASAAELGALQNQLLQVAREEMGHLMTVENLLLLIGAPLNFYREHSPFASEIYPFRFKLEPVSPASLAKYVKAESPFPLPDDLPDEDRDLYENTVATLAHQSNDGHEVLHVGPIFARLRMLFEHELTDDDFRLDRAAAQGTYGDWGFDRRSSESEHRLAGDLILESFPQTEVAQAGRGGERHSRHRVAGRRLRQRARERGIALRALPPHVQDGEPPRRSGRGDRLADAGQPQHHGEPVCSATVRGDAGGGGRGA